MNRIDQETINNIKNSVDIVEVISKYVNLESHGKNMFGLCPFHDDHSPSMSVSREKQIFTCFVCGQTGTVFDFIQKYDNVSFIESVKMCADIAGIPLDIKGYKENIPNSELYDMYELACKFYQNNINTVEGKEAKEYLNNRNIDDELIKHFRIGLALNNSKLSKTLQKKEYKEKDLLNSGLVNKKGYEYFDSFYSRIIIPIEDLTGKIVGFSGRIYNKEKDKNNPKYINTKETEIFKKGELLFNYKNAKDEARKLNTVIIMEGYMDLFRAYSIGVKNVVVSMGTKVTKEQASLLKRMADNVILCFDGDNPGADATYNTGNELINLGITPKVVRLPENLDPDEYILKYGKEDFINKINNPMSIMEFKLNYLKNNKDLNNSVDMTKYVNEILKEVNKIDDDVLKEITIKKLSIESNLDIEFLKSKLEVKEKVKEVKKIEQPKINKSNKYIKAEQYLLYYMMNDSNVIKMYQSNLGYMPTDKYRKLAFEINYFYKNNHYINISDLMINYNDDLELINTIKEINLLNLKEEYTNEEIMDYIKSIKDYNIKEESKRLKDLMRMEIDPIKKAEYANKILEIQKTRLEVE